MHGWHLRSISFFGFLWGVASVIIDSTQWLLCSEARQASLLSSLSAWDPPASALLAIFKWKSGGEEGGGGRARCEPCGALFVFFLITKTENAYRLFMLNNFHHCSCAHIINPWKRKRLSTTNDRSIPERKFRNTLALIIERDCGWKKNSRLKKKNEKFHVGYGNLHIKRSALASSDGLSVFPLFHFFFGEGGGGNSPNFWQFSHSAARTFMPNVNNVSTDIFAISSYLYVGKGDDANMLSLQILEVKFKCRILLHEIF